MGISADELVRLLAEYMGNDGYYMKPKVEDGGKSSFFMAKDKASSSAVNAGFHRVGDSIGEKEAKQPQVFSGKPRVECAVCADVPNLMDIVDDDDQ